MRNSLNERADLLIMKNLSNNALYDESLNESAYILIMKSLTENADSCDLAVHVYAKINCFDMKINRLTLHHFKSMATQFNPVKNRQVNIISKEIVLK